MNHHCMIMREIAIGSMGLWSIGVRVGMFFHYYYSHVSAAFFSIIHFYLNPPWIALLTKEAVVVRGP
jgi:hypothetical protein